MNAVVEFFCSNLYCAMKAAYFSITIIVFRKVGHKNKFDNFLWKKRVPNARITLLCSMKDFEVTFFSRLFSQSVSDQLIPSEARSDPALRKLFGILESLFDNFSANLTGILKQEITFAFFISVFLLSYRCCRPLAIKTSINSANCPASDKCDLFN